MPARPLGDYVVFSGHTPVGARHGNVALNLAGVFALLVVLFPIDLDGAAGASRPPASQLSIHGTTAILLFVCLAFVAIWRADKMLRLLPDPHNGKEQGFRRTYRIIRLAMVAGPVAAFINTLISGDKTRYVLWVEALGIWAFSAYWFVKSYAMSLSRAEEAVLEARGTTLADVMAA